MPKAKNKSGRNTASKKSSINWLNHFIELCVVILGVTIAFMLNSWKESSDMRKLEREYLQSMVEDLEVDIDWLDTLHAFSQQNLNSINHLLELIHLDDLSNDSLIRQYHNQLQSTTDFLPRNMTYVSMLNSGKFEIIRDFHLRMDIVHLYQSNYDFLNLIERNSNEQMRNFVIPFAAEGFNYNQSMIENREYFTSNKFIGIVNNIRYNLRYKVDYYAVMRDQAEELKKYILEYLNDN